MSKPPPQREPDPMAGVVDRLLAQLPGLQGQSEAPRSTVSRPPYYSSGSTVIRPRVVVQGQPLGAWLRVVLALGLGVTMAAWPYLRTCGLPLLGYLAAVVIVIVAGGWAAVACWRHRIALGHMMALALILYGIMLGLAELLPRTGYAVTHATWQCEASTSFELWTAAHWFQSGRTSL